MQNSMQSGPSSGRDLPRWQQSEAIVPSWQLRQSFVAPVGCGSAGVSSASDFDILNRCSVLLPCSIEGSAASHYGAYDRKHIFGF